jgi:hypothetical protein
METNTMIIGVVLIAVVLIPFLIMRNGIKKHDKSFLAELNAFAKEYDSVITKYDFLKDIAIGADQEKGLIFFIHHGDVLEMKKMVDLKEFKNVHLIKSMRTVTLQNHENSYVEKVGLSFHSPIKTVNFELFNTESGSLTLSGELQLAEKWEQILKLSIGEYSDANSRTKKAS